MDKAQSQYISWVILLGMIVGISFLLYNWSVDQARTAAEDLEERTDPIICNEIGFSVEGICQDFRSLQVNLTNSNNYEISGFVFRTLGLYPEDDDYLDSESLDMDLPPGDSENIIILKSGTLSQVQIIPLGERNNKDIFCEEKSITIEQDNLKQC